MEQSQGEFEQKPEAKPAGEIPFSKPKASKTPWILCAILLIIVLGLGGFLIFGAINRGEKPQCETVANNAGSKEGGSEGDTNENLSENVFENVIKIIREVHSVALKFARENSITDYSINSGLNGVMDYEFEKGYSASLKYAFTFNMSDTARPYSNTFMEKISHNPVFLKAVEEVFENHSMKKTKMNEGLFHDQDLVYFISNNGYICTYTTVFAGSFEVNCGHTGWLSNEKKELVKALIDAFVKSEGQYTPTFYMDASPDRIRSGDNNHQSISASFTDSGGSGEALFYRVSPDSEWIYFAATQQPLYCSEFVGEDVEQAFVGFTCLDKDNNYSTVGK